MAALKKRFSFFCSFQQFLPRLRIAYGPQTPHPCLHNVCRSAGGIYPDIRLCGILKTKRIVVDIFHQLAPDPVCFLLHPAGQEDKRRPVCPGEKFLHDHITEKMQMQPAVFHRRFYAARSAGYRLFQSFPSPYRPAQFNGEFPLLPHENLHFRLARFRPYIVRSIFLLQQTYLRPYSRGQFKPHGKIKFLFQSHILPDPLPHPQVLSLARRRHLPVPYLCRYAQHARPGAGIQPAQKAPGNTVYSPTVPDHSRLLNVAGPACLFRRSAAGKHFR